MAEKIKLADPWGVASELNKFYLDQNKKDSGPIWSGSANITPTAFVSAQGSVCDRYLAYKNLGTPPEVNFPIWLRKRFETGRDRDQRLAVNMKLIYGDRANFQVEMCIPELHMRGKADGELDGRYGFELKTVTTKQFEKVLSSQRPFQKDEDQVQFYFASLRWQCCTVLYECLDSMHNILPLVITPNEERYEFFRSRILEQVLAPLNECRMPAPATGSHCTQCQYRKTCTEELNEVPNLQERRAEPHPSRTRRTRRTY